MISGDKNYLDSKHLIDIIKYLFILSESRGKEASGFAGIDGDSILVLKNPKPASEMIKTAHFIHHLQALAKKKAGHFSIIGHSRLVTNGYEHFNYNNQPVVKKGMVGVHNGIVVNIDDLWNKHPSEKRETDLDTEIIPVLLDKYQTKEKKLSNAVKGLFDEIYGMTNIAFLLSRYQNMLLATNNGSIYYISDKKNQFFAFASEHYILEQLLKRNSCLSFIPVEGITQLQPGHALMVNFMTANLVLVDIMNPGTIDDNPSPLQKPLKIVEVTGKDGSIPGVINSSLDHRTEIIPKEFAEKFEKVKSENSLLKRCTKCILPETFPYIEFDQDGECNYCKYYSKINYKGREAFIKDLKLKKQELIRPEVLMPFSGGRDSSFALHYVVKELGIKPLAYSYDWGMITDLARRNQARMCGKLGVEHILVSADIRKKRENIRKNVLAWLKKPSLGTVPLFMAGDKQYFYFANLLMKQNKLDVSILGENLLETTKFKSGFCGIRPRFGVEHTYSLSLSDKLKMAAYYGKEYLLNPAYLNSSLTDTLDAFRSYYIINHRNINLFSYIKWDEKIITDILVKEYDWETDPGTRSTWRIGDGTAAFYNYIYYIVAGFTENDTFRSNQIREGDIVRQEALKLASEENRPRWDSIQWYCRTIGIDFGNTIRIVNNIPKLY